MFTDTANYVSRYFYRRHTAMLFLRLVTGVIFIAHGAMKLESAPMMAGFFGSLGLHPALFWVWFIGLLEVIGGIALIVGIAARAFGVLLAIEMFVAIFLTGFGKGILAPHEFELLLAAAALAVGLSGPGRYALYRKGCDSCGGVFCAGDTCVVQAPEL
jgi:putative oxidoreductase